ncbi:MAG TPA: hypothetical protein VM580_29555 [Labilithrix sp.]|nr:hypothetical protein [Labilithrix sp.]
MACATDVGTDVEGEEGEAADGAEVTGTTSSELTAAPGIPRVLSRTASGSSLVFRFDRVVTASEIPFAEMRVDVVRRESGQFKRLNVFRNAALSSDGKSLTMNLTESVRRGTAYYARGKWKKCVSIPFVNQQACRTFPAEFGQVVATGSGPFVVNGSVFTNATAATLTFAAKAASPFEATFAAKAASPSEAADAARVTRVAVADTAPTFIASAGPGTFRVKSMTPIESSEANTRDLRTITIQFEGGTIDCSKILPGEAGFKLYSRSPDLGAQQLMFDDPTGPLPTDFNYKGDLRCQEPENRVIFTTPGRLFGDVQYMIEANFTSKQGDTLRVEKDFYTERPGIRVIATRIDNRYGDHGTCDSDGIFGSNNYCDIYVTSAIAGGANATQAARIPESGDFSEMRFFDKDPINGRRDFFPGKVLFQTDKPVGVALELDLMAHDADSTSGWKKFLEVAGTIASKAGTAIAAVEPAAGAITAGVGESLTLISEAIPTNDDDKLGTAKYTVTRESSRWGTTHFGPHVIPLDNASNDSRGPVNVYVYFEEFPAPWRPPAPIL